MKAVDFFCGAGGMSYGLSQAGIEVLAGIDNSNDCQDTYEHNIPGARYIRHDIVELSAAELIRRLGIKRNDPDLIFCGCSPCQFWSKIRTDKSKSEKTAFLLKQFQRFIRHFRPGFVVVENVPGLARTKDHTILAEFIEFLSELGYRCSDGIINAAHFGVPQNRIRYLLIASRVGDVRPLPKADTGENLAVADFIGPKNGFPPIEAGTRDTSEFNHTARSLSGKNLERIAMTPASGGTRTAWAGRQDLQIDAYRDSDQIFRDVYGRMSWDKPAPTITTKFLSLSNGRFGHPEENRALSVREGATLQTFPREFVFRGNNLEALGRQIGNAVPPALAKRIGEHLMGLRYG
ncbi:MULTISPECIES: DNA cytosine methyltransferase [Rhizobium]|uniref:DNA cytosine methyltransferase n=1 Tax=Rhizobium TaxID=379 RepID=UPI0019D47EC3|nr:DNA cytosine methyltransferase [Rhizobium leguminosarum]